MVGAAYLVRAPIKIGWLPRFEKRKDAPLLCVYANTIGRAGVGGAGPNPALPPARRAPMDTRPLPAVTRGTAPRQAMSASSPQHADAQTPANASRFFFLFSLRTQAGAKLASSIK